MYLDNDTNVGFVQLKELSQHFKKNSATKKRFLA
jgi:hypothetical protein